MKITILTGGSRGDYQPYIALGVGLKQAGHSVCVPAPKIFRDMVVKNGLQYVEMRGIDPQEFVKSMELKGSIEASNKLMFMSRMFRELRGAVEALYNEAWEACQDSDFIVSNLAFLGAYDIAEKLGIPCFFCMLFPVHATSAYPSALAPNFIQLGAYNRMAHVVTEQLVWQPFRMIINHWRKEKLGLKPQGFFGPFKTIYRRKTPVLCGYSPSVIPKPKDWPEMMQVPGYWFLDEASDWQPDPELAAFLESGPPPVYFGLGSMTVKDPERISQMVLEALERSGQRGIISAGWSGLADMKLPDNILRIGSVPHSWLFKRMALIVHHGGAGTTAAALRAGVPAIIIPFLFDQPFWGQCISSLGVGKVLTYKHLTAEKLAGMIEHCLRDQQLQDRTRALGSTIESEDGVGKAVEIIERHLATLNRK